MKIGKPLGGKAYGSIPHLPGSRMGPKDQGIHPGQARICTEKARDRHDTIIVQEKLDGSCTAVARVNGELVALGRAGYLASTSPFEQHHMFAKWVKADPYRFGFLDEGERAVGEWLAQAHGTRYKIEEPWVLFDIMRDHERMTVEDLKNRAGAFCLTPVTLSRGAPVSIEQAITLLGKHGHHGAIDPAEGCVWRVERDGKVDFLAKYVRPKKIDGKYLPELSGGETIWNWHDH